MLYSPRVVSPERKELPKPFKPPAWLFHKKYRLRWFLLFAFLFSIQVLPRVWQDSALPDEAWETTTGYYYWVTGEASKPFNQPPLANALQAFPLLFLHLSIDHQPLSTEDRAYSFFYVINRDQLDWIIGLPRLVTLVFALLTGFLLYRLMRKESLPVFLFALVFWAFEPTLLTYAVIAKTDTFLVFFSFAALLLFLKGQREPRARWDVLAGVFCGMAVTSKLSGFSLIPLFLLLDLWEAWERPGFCSRLGLRWLRGASAFAFLVFLVYLPATLRMPGHLWPFTYLRLDVEQYLWYGRNQLEAGAFHTLFLGQWFDHEPLWHLPVIFILKSAMPFVLLLSAGFLLLGQAKMPRWMWLFPAGWTVLLVNCPTVFLRYALPAYPALILIAAKGAGWLWQKGKARRWRILKPVLLLLGVLNVLSVTAHFSNQIPYFNDLVPPDEKGKLLSACYYDLDQDLKRLGQVARDRHWTHVKLAYVGQDDPYYYGLPLWEPWTVRDLDEPQWGTVYVVQRGFLETREPSAEKKFPIGESWVGDVEPTGSVGEGWVYFEVPGKWKGEDLSPAVPSTPSLVYQNAPYRRPR